MCRKLGGKYDVNENQMKDLPEDLDSKIVLSRIKTFLTGLLLI